MFIPNFKNQFSYIFVIDEASDFRFGKPLGFTKAHHKISAEEKWAWPWARKLPKILDFPFNISATAKANDFKFGIQLEFVKAITKSQPKKKMGVALG